jgi:hypothetical protein
MGDNFDPDTTAMAAAITQLTGLVQGLQGQMAQMQSHMAAAAMQSTEPSGPASVAAQTATAGQVTGKLKLPQPKPLEIPPLQVQWRTICLIMSSISLAWMFQRIGRYSLLLVCWRVPPRPGGVIHIMLLRRLAPLTHCLYGIHSVPCSRVALEQ